MTQHAAEDQPTNLTEAAQELIAELPDHRAGRCARTLIGGSGQRVVLMALAQGSALSEHDAPGAASIQVIQGNIRLIAGDSQWTLTAGELLRIPPQRHSVEADADSAFVLTVALHA